MKQLSRERLIKIANGGGYNFSEIEEMAHLLLAGMDQEPVAWEVKGILCHTLAEANVYVGTPEPLYAAPPSPVVPDLIEKANKLAEMHGCSFVVFTHGEDPQIADPRKVIISFTDKGLGYTDTGNSPVIPDCWCRTCRPVTMNDTRFVVCPDCGNKRCPKANDHRHACSGSNEPGQEGSAYPADKGVEDEL